MSEKAMAREKYDSNEGWLEDVIMNAWLENDLKRKRELAHRGLAQEAAIAVAAALPPLRAREEIARAGYEASHHEDDAGEYPPAKTWNELETLIADAAYDPIWKRELVAHRDLWLKVADAILSLPAVQGEGRVPDTLLPLAEVEAEAQRCRKILDDYPSDENSDMLYAAYNALLFVLSYGVAQPSELFGSAALSSAPPAPAPEGEWRPDVDEIARAICGHPRGCQLALGLCDQCKDDINVLGVLKAAARVAALHAPPVAEPIVADEQTERKPT